MNYSFFKDSENVSQPQDIDPDALDNKCSKNSFLIGDGVCDDITNTKRCLFDGGDCCLSRKNTKLCIDCTCTQNGTFLVI